VGIMKGLETVGDYISSLLGRTLGIDSSPPPGFSKIKRANQILLGMYSDSQQVYLILLYFIPLLSCLLGIL
jgi:hypothetical protein